MHVRHDLIKTRTLRITRLAFNVEYNSFVRSIGDLIVDITSSDGHRHSSMRKSKRNKMKLNSKISKNKQKIREKVQKNRLISDGTHLAVGCSLSIEHRGEM